ncbi:MAG: holo-ACP synthase [Myxococcales bacterium]|nr:holo-ACP synthase [Myxococcales bacterium]
MVVGLGIDVCSVERMRLALERHGDKFWQRILTPAEQRELTRRGDRAVALAGRFAAKEAASKALGAPKDVWWQSVEILRGNDGSPTLHFSGPALPHLSARGVSRSLISITHDAGVAAAVVVLEGV